MSNPDAVEIRPLIHDDADQHSTVGAALNGQFLGVSETIGNEVLGSCVAIIKGVLFLEESAGIVPKLAILPTTQDNKPIRVPMKQMLSSR